MTAEIVAHPAADDGREHARQVAHIWAARGVPVFPAAIGWDPTKYGGQGGTTKRPLTAHGHLDATLDPTEIDQLYNNARPRPGEHVGTALLPGPANLLALDLDRKGGVNGIATAETLGLRDTWGANTPSGGEHRIYRIPPGVHITNHSPWEGIDIRSGDGWIIAPGTQTPYGNWARADDLYRWPDDVANLPAEILGRLQTRAATSSSSTGWTRLTPEQRAELHPATLAAVEHLETLGGHNPIHKTAPDREPWVELTRPGKRHGTSCSIGYIAPGVIKTFTPNWPGLPEGTHETDHNGQPILVGDWTVTPPPHVDPDTGEITTPPPDDATLAIIDHVDQFRINWQAFWDNDHDDEQWAIPNFLAEGRQHALFARGGQGKSLFTLALTTPAAINGTNILYCDYEMTQADLASRLEALGYGPETNLEHLHYLSLPSIPPLDTIEGGRTLVTYARHVQAQIVIVDTAARAVAGPEDKADTYRDLYKWTGVPFKRDGTTVLRIDHAGHQNTGAARGSSAKNDDVDVVWELTVTDDTATLTARKTRMGWVPKTARWAINRNGPLTYTTSNAPGWPEHTKTIADILDAAQIDLTATYTQARAAIPETAPGRRKGTILAAQRYRRQKAEQSWTDTP
jgi:hypothetical protein